MPVVQVQVFLEKDKEKKEVFFCGKGLWKEDKLYFKNKQEENKLWIQKDTILFQRKLEKEGEFYFTFKEKELTVIQYKSRDGNVEIPLYTQRLMIEKEKIEINYIVADSEQIELAIELEWK